MFNFGQSDLEILSLDIDQFTSPNTDEDRTDVLLAERLVDYWLFRVDPCGNLAEEIEIKCFESQHSILFPLEIRAPLKSICPDKKYSDRSRIK